METGNVLVVDDDPEIRSLIAESLHRSGFEILTAADGREALDKVIPGRTRLVISDVKMPAMSGIELLRRVKQMTSEIPVLIVTGTAVSTTRLRPCRRGLTITC